MSAAISSFSSLFFLENFHEQTFCILRSIQQFCICILFCIRLSLDCVLSPKYFQICILEKNYAEGLTAHHQHYQRKEAILSMLACQPGGASSYDCSSTGSG